MWLSIILVLLESLYIMIVTSLKAEDLLRVLLLIANYWQMLFLLSDPRLKNMKRNRLIFVNGQNILILLITSLVLLREESRAGIRLRRH